MSFKNMTNSGNTTADISEQLDSIEKPNPTASEEKFFEVQTNLKLTGNLFTNFRLLMPTKQS